MNDATKYWDAEYSAQIGGWVVTVTSSLGSEVVAQFFGAEAEDSAAAYVAERTRCSPEFMEKVLAWMRLPREEATKTPIPTWTQHLWKARQEQRESAGLQATVTPDPGLEEQTLDSPRAAL